MATLVMATDHYKHTLNKKCGLQGQSVQVLEGPNHRSGRFRRCIEHPSTVGSE